MRSTSRPPSWSNRQSSTFSALAEKSAKLVPRPSQVAPRGCGAPAESRRLELRDEKNGSQGRNNKTDLGNSPSAQRVDAATVPDIAAAIERGIGVEHLAPATRERHLDTIVAMDFRREIDHHQTALAYFPTFAQPREDA